MALDFFELKMKVNWKTLFVLVSIIIFIATGIFMWNYLNKSDSNSNKNEWYFYVPIIVAAAIFTSSFVLRYLEGIKLRSSYDDRYELRKLKNEIIAEFKSSGLIPKDPKNIDQVSKY